MSDSARDKPAIDPQYYAGTGGELDLDIMVECVKFAEQLTHTPPLAQIVRGRVSPAAEVRADGDLREWLVRETVCDW